jgi:adenine-specific DNA-methyltransferase
MPTPMCIEKDKVTDYHNEVPFAVLTRNENLSVNSNGTENHLIRGDNLEALKALLPCYSNRLRVIYIGPPNSERLSVSTRRM